MQNWCINSLEIVSDEATRKSILATVTTVPPTVDGINNEGQEAYIFQNLLPDWNTPQPSNYFPVLLDYNTEISSDESDENVPLQFVFSTAPAPPCGSVLRISKNYPDAHFILTWEDSELCYMGGAVYKAGEVLHEVTIEGDDYPQFDGDFASEEDADSYQKYADDMCDLRDRIQTELWEVTQDNDEGCGKWGCKDCYPDDEVTE